MSGDLVKLLLVLAGLLAVYALILGGPARTTLGGGLRGRVGRPPRGISTQYADPTAEGPAAVLLGSLAVGSIAENVGHHVGLREGAAVGAVLAISLTIRPLRRWATILLSTAAIVATIIEAAAFIGDSDEGLLGQTYRSAVVLLSSSCFLLSVILFNRRSALAAGRALVLFGLIDITTFLAGPAGAHLYDLGTTRHLIYLCALCAVSAAMGWAASELTLSLAAVGATVAAVGLELSGLGNQHGNSVGAAASALVTYIVVMIVLRQLQR
ncbi:hypothetical protein [Arsenicicoccus bolidensis]|uniref:hypothetical protein n=1 Tax=Arsenicicoccus bolidensis TaxID=229480 RepID=UPI0028AAA1D2|nr:hypothetical protein [Arsenicicoccus bolidensis]